MTNDDDVEQSEGGSPIYRHQARERKWKLPEHPGEHLEIIEAHVEEHIGKIEGVFHEILSDLIHLDVLTIPATDDRPFHVLVTSGVSDEPMNVPEGMEEFNRAELLIALPAEWPLSQEAFANEDFYWPIRWLKMVGRMPHEYETWIGWGHTIPNFDPPEPIANTKFTGVMLTPPYWLGEDFLQLETPSGETISFYSVVPLYQEEMDFKLKHGAEALEDLFEKHDVDFAICPGRPNAAKKKGWLW